MTIVPAYLGFRGSVHKRQKILAAYIAACAIDGKLVFCNRVNFVL
jgi:hypothetical protein